MTAQAVGTRTHWNDRADGYDSAFRNDEARQRLLAAIVEEVPAGTARILDLGSGTGALTFLCERAFPVAAIVGLDPAPRMVETARRNAGDSRRVSFIEGFADALERFASHSFDAIVSNFALHHLTNEEKKHCAGEVFRLLRPGGCFVFGDQHAAHMGALDDRQRIHHLVDLLASKAHYYLEHAGFARMVLQLELLPKFIKEEGEIMVTPEFWTDALHAAGFQKVAVRVVEPEWLLHRVIVAES
jgi:ubiquinone/menaquinone biosynthesis C-methylase UbiE